jgi:hypothetical protein
MLEYHHFQLLNPEFVVLYCGKKADFQTETASYFLEATGKPLFRVILQQPVGLILCGLKFNNSCKKYLCRENTPNVGKEEAEG